MNRRYRVLIAASEAGLYAAAGANWTILRNTVREFVTLESNDDHSLGDIGDLYVDQPGWVALAYLEAD